jgi:dipeptidyl aminopeptidase/acylaminoacyl peptidase
MTAGTVRAGKALHLRAATPPRYDPQGWNQWPDHPEFSFQFLRTLAGAQRDASTIGECFLAASRIDPLHLNTWTEQWQRLAHANQERARAAQTAGHAETARANWQRAATYWRTSAFHLALDDIGRLAAVERAQACTLSALRHHQPAGEAVRIDMADGSCLYAYFLKPAGPGTRWPTVIAFGGLDEAKDELLQKFPKFAHPRGLAVLLVDLPGQGATLQRQGLVKRHDNEVPVARCIDWLEHRADVDAQRIGVYGSSLGGTYAARAAAFEPRLACAVSDGMVVDLNAHLRALAASQPDSLIWTCPRSAFGTAKLDELLAKAADFQLTDVLGRIACPYLVVQGALDYLGAQGVLAYQLAKNRGVNATLKVFSAEDTGAAHCQIDNATLAMEFICDWLADRLVAAGNPSPT